MGLGGLLQVLGLTMARFVDYKSCRTDNTAINVIAKA